MNAAGMPAATSPLRREARACQPGQPAVRGPDDQHVRGTRSRLLLVFRVLFFPFFPRSGLRGVLVQHVHRGLVRGQRVLAGQCREHRSVEPGLAQLRRQPGAGLVHPARRDRNPQQHGHHLRGPLGRHVPVRGQNHRGGVQDRPVGHRAGVRARRRLGERDRPAALAQPAFQLRNPQLQPPVPLQHSVQLYPQHRVLSVLRLDHGPQPGQQLTLLPGTSRRIRHIGHEPRSCSSSTTGSSTPYAVSRRPHPHPVNGHKDRPAHAGIDVRAAPSVGR